MEDQDTESNNFITSLYGSESWSLTFREEHYWKVLKTKRSGKYSDIRKIDVSNNIT
jgi:hypothetical protein